MITDVFAPYVVYITAFDGLSNLLSLYACTTEFRKSLQNPEVGYTYFFFNTSDWYA